MKFLKYINWLLTSQVGIDPRKMYGFIIGFPRFFNQLANIKRLHDVEVIIKPCVHDAADAASSRLQEYFYQDLFVAQMVFDKSPAKLADVGSRVDGYVANVASFREITVFDIRPLANTIKNVNFIIRDISKIMPLGNTYEMVTCLHALEHFGLGRYGDPITKSAVSDGVMSLSNLVSDNGMLLISTPIGRERIEFNANWVFDPGRLFRIFESSGLSLEETYRFDSGNNCFELVLSEEILGMSDVDYCLAIFVLKKRVEK